MPYFYIHCELKSGTHPNETIIDKPDKEMREYLQAQEKPEYTSKAKHWEAPFCPGVVLTLLEKKGYRLVSSCCNSDTMHWTLVQEEKS